MRSKVFFLLLATLLAHSVYAKVITREEALRAAFPNAEIQYTPMFLTKAEMDEVKKIAGTEVPSALVASYRATTKGKLIGRAYLDTHVVRTKKESLLVLLNPEGTIKRVEVVAFLEPPEYLAPDRWYEQFNSKQLDEDLRLKRDIHPVTGASHTAQATVDATRRILAIDEIVRRKEVAKQP
jgi:electron transport complex protein RnfG